MLNVAFFLFPPLPELPGREFLFQPLNRQAHDIRVGTENTFHNEIAVLGYLFNVWECIREAEEVKLSVEQAGLLAHNKEKYITP